MHRVQETLYRLFFTRDDDLDLLQLVFLVWLVFVAYAVHEVGTGEWTLPTAAWSVIGSVFATLAIAGTPKWIAVLLAKRNEPTVYPTSNFVGGYPVSFTDDDDRWYGVDDPE